MTKVSNEEQSNNANVLLAVRSANEIDLLAKLIVKESLKISRKKEVAEKKKSKKIIEKAIADAKNGR